LKVLKMVAYVGLLKTIVPASPPPGPPEGGACTNPLPGVVNRAPRGFRNTSNGVPPSGVAVMGGLPPSQLISRRPLGNDASVLPLLGSPRARRYASTAPLSEAAFGPAA